MLLCLGSGSTNLKPSLNRVIFGETQRKYHHISNNYEARLKKVETVVIANWFQKFYRSSL